MLELKYMDLFTDIDHLIHLMDSSKNNNLKEADFINEALRVDDRGALSLIFQVMKGK